MAPIVIFTRLIARPGRRNELLDAFAPFLDAVADEPGTEVFVMHTARDDADIVLFYEVYRDDAALAAHRDSDAVRDLVPRLGDLLAGPPEITYAPPRARARRAADRGTPTAADRAVVALGVDTRPDHLELERALVPGREHAGQDPARAGCRRRPARRDRVCRGCR